MATYRYWNVRRDIYDFCASTPLKNNRTFQDMKKLFRWSYWAVLVIMALLLLSLLIITIFSPHLVKYFMIPLGCTLLLPILIEVWGEKMYHHPERQRELDERAENLDEYLKNIKTILVSHGIKTPTPIDYLRNECEERLKQHGREHLTANSRFYVFFIGIAIGGLVSIIATLNNSAEMVISTVIFLIIVVFAIVGVLKVIEKITYYSNGCFKDRILLDMLNELNYFSD